MPDFFKFRKDYKNALDNLSEDITLEEESLEPLDESVVISSSLSSMKDQIDDLTEKLSDGLVLDDWSKNRMVIASDFIDDVYHKLTFGDYEAQTTNEETDVTSMLHIIVENELTKEFKLSDQTKVSITPELAAKLVRVHDDLTEENRMKFKFMLGESAESYKLILDFCESQKEND